MQSLLTVLFFCPVCFQATATSLFKWRKIINERLGHFMVHYFWRPNSIFFVNYFGYIPCDQNIFLGHILIERFRLTLLLSITRGERFCSKLPTWCRIQTFGGKRLFVVGLINVLHSSNYTSITFSYLQASVHFLVAPENKTRGISARISILYHNYDLLRYLTKHFCTSLANIRETTYDQLASLIPWRS